jgi:DNA-binding transcriptional LysR family regulator
MNNLTLRQLSAFIAVAECGGFRRAGEQLRRSQSAVSAHIRELELELGIALFHRTTRRVSLTPEGERLLGRARRALAELESAVREVRDEVALQRGRVVIGAPPTVSSTRLPHLVARFRLSHPGIEVQIQEDFASGIMERVRGEAVDFAVTPRIEGTEEFTFETILRDDFAVVLPADHPRAGAKEIAFADIADEPFLALPRATELRNVLDHMFRAQDRNLQPAFEVMHHLTLMGMVAAGLGVTILPELCLGGHGMPIATARLIRPRRSRHISIATRRGQALSPAAAACANLIRESFASAEAA